METKIGRQTATKRTPVGMLGLIEACKYLKRLVGPPGFEPGTSCTPSKAESITYKHRILKTQELRAMNLDAKAPPKAISWSFRLLTDSNASPRDCGITRASRARARSTTAPLRANALPLPPGEA